MSSKWNIKARRPSLTLIIWLLLDKRVTCWGGKGGPGRWWLGWKARSRRPPTASTVSLPCFLWVPSPYGFCDQLQTTLFSKNKHAYGIGGSFVAIKGNNRVFKKITLHFK